jgi:hypothetical protein
LRHSGEQVCPSGLPGELPAASAAEPPRCRSAYSSRRDRTYGHLLPDSIDRARTALETFGHLAATAAQTRAEDQ